MNSETLTRIEIESLQPGDVFEYYHDRLDRMVRDTVTTGPDWRDESDRVAIRTGKDFYKAYGKLMTSVYTEQGENNHGYVTVPARTVVVLVKGSTDE